MIGDPVLRSYAYQTRAARNIALQEVVLTYVLAALYDQSFSRRLAFKGGTALRKLLFGPRGRFSIDLDFLGRDMPDDDVLDVGMFVDRLSFHGLECRLMESRFTASDPDEFGHPQPQGFSASVAFGCELGNGRFEVDVSRRRSSLLRLAQRDLVDESYHRFLEFPLPRPLALATEENIAEKVSALARRLAHRNAKDVYDLYLYLPRPNDQRLLGRLIALTIWLDLRDIGGAPEHFVECIQPGAFDWETLRDVLPNRSVLPEVVCRAVREQLSQITAALSDDERRLIDDALHHSEVGLFTLLRQELEARDPTHEDAP